MKLDRIEDACDRISRKMDTAGQFAAAAALEIAAQQIRELRKEVLRLKQQEASNAD